jgi:hypothetical protein
MKRVKFLIIVMAFALMGLSARGQITFQKAFRLCNSYEYIQRTVSQTSDGGYIISGTTDNFGAGNTDLYLIKTNENGDTLWTRTFGGSGDDFGYCVKQINGGGYLMTGVSYDFGFGAGDVYLIRLDINGDTLWTKTYGGTQEDCGISILESSDDSGFVIAGYTWSFGAGAEDYYLIKIDGNGNILWTKSYGGDQIDNLLSADRTSDGGYILIGDTYSFGTNSDRDVYLVKTNSIGDTLWTRIYSGIGNDDAWSVKQTPDGGYIIAGGTNSFDASGFYDFFLIKTDSLGDTLWAKTYGGANDDYAESLEITSDGGYIIIGKTDSYGAGANDIYLIKTNVNGDILWTKTYGGLYDDVGNSVKQTDDGGYIITGSTESFGSGIYDIYLIKTDSSGNSGCNQSNTATVVGHAPFNIKRPPTIVSSGGVALSPHTIANRGSDETSICTTAGITEIKNNNYLLLSPNPFTTTTTLTLQGTCHNPSLFIYNLLGQEVRSIPIGSNTQLTINRDHLASGMYFYKLIDENKEVIGIGKMIVE